jgi:hypothetical protein
MRPFLFVLSVGFSGARRESIPRGFMHAVRRAGKIAQ